MARTDRFQQVDLATGEILEDSFVAVVQPKRHNGFTSGWIAMAQGPLEEVAVAVATGRLQGKDRAVLDMLIARLDTANYIQVQQVEIADRLHMEKQHVNRSIRRLIEEGILVEGPKVGRSCSYRLSPEYGWKGSAKSHVKELAEYRKNRLKLVHSKADAETAAQAQAEAERKALEAAGQQSFELGM